MILFSGGHIIGRGDDLRHAVTLSSGESADLLLLCLSGGRAFFDIDIAGRGADVNLRGLFVCAGDDRLDIKVNMRHGVGGGTSAQLFKGVAAGRAKVRFEGRIVVAPDAQNTEAYQTGRGLLLSEGAVIELQPQLEIYADDVKCSHGAAVGSLDEDEQFYMRSRGISLEEARRLQMLSFLSPVMEGLDGPSREQVLEHLKSLQ